MMTRGGWIIVGVAIAISALAYANSLPNGFHFDDGHSIQENAWLRDLGHIPRFFWDITTFSPLAENRSYRPALLIGFAVSHAMGGGAPWAYRIVSIALHALAAATIGLLTVRLWRAQAGPNEAETQAAWAAGVVAAAVMAAHPLATEAVNYASARSSLQAAALMFVSVALYVRARETDPAPSGVGATLIDRQLILSALVLLLAMATKIIAVTAPALAVGWALTLGAERPGGAARGYGRLALSVVPLAGVAFGFTALHEAMVGQDGIAARSAVGPWQYFLTEAQVWVRFQRLFFWPSDLCADLTMAWSQSLTERPVALSLVWAALLLALAVGLWRRRPLFTFGVGWFFVALSPTNSFVPLSEPASEHRVYIALPGLIWAVLGLLGPEVARFAHVRPRWRRALVAVFVVAILALGATTWRRNRVWRNDETLWGGVLQCAPDNGRAHLNYGRARFMAGDLQGAAKSFARCRELLPRWIFCRINQAALALGMKNYKAAEYHMAAARQLQPDNVYTLAWSGRVRLARGDATTAAQAYRRALEVAPGYEDAEAGLGRALVALGRMDEARPLLDRIGHAGRLDALGYVAWAQIAAHDGDVAAARARYQRALVLEPGLEAAERGLRALTNR